MKFDSGVVLFEQFCYFTVHGKRMTIFNEFTRNPIFLVVHVCALNECTKVIYIYVCMCVF